MQTYILRVPCRVKLRTRKRDNKDIFFRLNLNEYRNTHHRDLALSKVLYSELIKPLLTGMGQFKSINLEYKLFPSNKRKIDTNNVLTIVDKYFQDCLVSQGIIPNDTYEYVISTEFSFGEIDKEEEYHYAEVKIIGV